MDELHDKLSVLLDDHDGEAGKAALDLAIDEVGRDVNLQYQLRRYRLIGETLRNELPPAIDTTFNAAVMARIVGLSGRQPVPDRAAPAPRQSLFDWLTRPVAGLAVAAAVAVLTVTLWQPQNQVDDDSDRLVAAPPPVVDADTELAMQLSPGMRWKIDNPAMQQKLNAYLVNHTEYASYMQGIIPQARVAGYDSSR